jgi:hypothetical protein
MGLERDDDSKKSHHALVAGRGALAALFGAASVALRDAFAQVFFTEPYPPPDQVSGQAFAGPCDLAGEAGIEPAPTRFWKPPLCR